MIRLGIVDLLGSLIISRVSFTSFLECPGKALRM